MIRINSESVFCGIPGSRGARRVEIFTKAGTDTVHGDDRPAASRQRDGFAKPCLADQAGHELLHRERLSPGSSDKSSRDRASFLVSGGRWRQDDNAFVHATVLSPGAGSPQPFGATVATPSTVRSGSAQVDVTAGSHTINASLRAGRGDGPRTWDCRAGSTCRSTPTTRSGEHDGTGAGCGRWTSIGQHMVNDARFEIQSRRLSATQPLASAPAVIVLDAFNAGGNQSAPVERSVSGWLASETLTLQRGSTPSRPGAQIESTRQAYVDRSGFGGTYTFGASDVEHAAPWSRLPVLNAARRPIPISPIEHYAGR